MTIRSRSGALLLLAGLVVSGAVQAGRSCEPRPLTPAALITGLDLAQHTADALDAEHVRSGARVVLLARAGQDLRDWGLRWSHLGWAYKSPEGPWRVLHKLNTCGTAVGSIYRQGLGEFFLDDLWRHEAVWVVPAQTLQQPLYTLLTDPQRSLRLHERRYNMVAYPWSTSYQQSNQWGIETLAMAAEAGITTRMQAQAWLAFKGYQPSALRIGTFKRLGAGSTTAHIRFDDHPNAKRFAGRIETVTVDSVIDWLSRAGLGSVPATLSR